MPHGQRASSRRCPIYGSGGGFTSRLLEAQSGWLPPTSARALRLNWRHGPMWDWIGGLLMMYQHCRAAFGSFLRRWFYVTAPRGTKWVAAPDFRSGPPPQLASWANVGLDWGPANDVPTLQSRIRELLERDISLVSVIQVMLVRRALPCKRRPLRMWEFNPEGP